MHGVDVALTILYCQDEIRRFEDRDRSGKRYGEGIRTNPYYDPVGSVYSDNTYDAMTLLEDIFLVLR